jgi:hypothetical protein
LFVPRFAATLETTMRWDEIRKSYPNTWLVIEAVLAHSDGGRRVLDEAIVIEQSADGSTAFRRYRELHKAMPAREIYFVHTGNEALVIDERPWVGVRWGDAVNLT